MKKTVFHLVQSNVKGGLENVYLDYCKILHQEFDLVCIMSSGFVHLDEIKKLGIKTEILNIKGHFDIFSAIKFRCLFKKYSPNVVIAHNGRSFSVVNWFRSVFGNKKLKSIAVSHGGNPKRLVNFDYIVTVADHVRKNIVNKHKLIASKTRTIHNGVKINNNPLQVRAGKEPIIFGTLSSILPGKNIITAIKALKLFLQDVPDAKLKIAGDGSDLIRLKDFVKLEKLQDNVEFAGHVTDIEGFFNSIDLFVHPSISEAFSLTILEAFNYYTPVIASDIDNFKEIIRDKENGFIYEDPTNEQNLYQVMREYYFHNLQNKDQITAAARKDLQENFSKAVAEEKLIKLVNCAIG